MLKPKQDLDDFLDDAPAGTQVEDARDSIQQRPDAVALPRRAKVLETSLLFASGLLLLSWTAVLGWLAYELVSWLTS